MPRSSAESLEQADEGDPRKQLMKIHRSEHYLGTRPESTGIAK